MRLDRRTISSIILSLIAAVTVVGTGFSFKHRSDFSGTILAVANGSPQDEDYHGIRAFKTYVEAASGGQLTVTIFNYGEFCGSDRECMGFLRSGLLDIFMTTAGGVGYLFGPAQIIDMPYAFSDEALAECVLDGPLAAELQSAVARSGLPMRLMVIANTGGWRSFATIARAIRNPQDLRGMKIRTTSAEMQQVFVRQFAATPVPISWAESYIAMATGIVDGTTNSLSDIVAGNLHERIKYITLDNHSYMGAFWWYSQKKWAALDAADRRVISSGFERLKMETRNRAKLNHKKATKTFIEQGGTIIALSPRQRRAFEDASHGVAKWFETQYGAQWLHLLDRAVARCQKS
ncbi:MAG: C4-dicarboxylate ABC transporter substrate-binding protein [Alphaproteobacteria bacterium]|nr:MAG: C4-dicarboxylate ABC transporter substrate-binding protein [Alphaproteobacteria bacterium]